MNSAVRHELDLLHPDTLAGERVRMILSGLDNLTSKTARMGTLRSWFLREFRRENPQDWLRGEQGAGRLPTSNDYRTDDAQFFRQLYLIIQSFDYLRRHGQRLPNFQRMEWSELVQWASTTTLGPRWESRDILRRFDNGWTFERVWTPDDLELEGVLMENCVSQNTVMPAQALYSLRNPDGFPRVNVFLTDGMVTEVLGRGNNPFIKPRYTEMLHEHFSAGPERTYYWYWSEKPSESDEADHLGIYSVA